MKKLLLILPLVFLLCFAFSCQKAEEEAEKASPEKMPPIIDVHMHAFWSRGPVEWMHLDIAIPPTDEELLQDCLEIMDRHNVVLGLVSSWSPYIEQWKDAAPERFVISSAIYPENLNNSKFIDQIKEKCQSGEYAWIGEVCVQYGGISPDSPIMEPIFALAEESQIPVCIHMGLGPPGIYNSFPEYRIALSSALLLEDVLVRHPNLRIWVAHAGWPLLDEMVALLYAYPQVYVDIGVINWFIPREEFHAYLKRLVDAGFSERIMFGSDQMFWPDAIELAIEGVDSAEFLTEAQKRDILYNNAVRFLQLDENTSNH